MTTYLVVCAMDEELSGLLEGLDKTELDVNGQKVYQVKTDEATVYATKGGIGKVSMAYTLGRLLAGLDVDYVINVGVAGSISRDLKKLETFVATKACYNDVDVRAFGYAYGQMASQPLYFKADEELVRKAVSLNPKTIKPGLIVSGDSFITKENIDPMWFEAFDNPIACDMESAAVGQVCHQANLPFMILRSISDSPAEEGNTAVYDTNLDDASRTAGKLIRQLILNK